MSPTSPVITSVDPANIPLPSTSTNSPTSDTFSNANSKVLKGLEKYSIRWS